MTSILAKSLTPQDLRFNPPCFDQAWLLDFVGKTYGLSGTLQPLKGERDQNHKLTTQRGEQFVVKISGADEDISIVDFQVQALLHVENTAPDLMVPRMIPALDGKYITQIVGQDGQTHQARLLSYLAGVPLGDGRVPSLPVLKELGSVQGKLCAALKDFHHPASKLFMPWDISNELVLNSSLLKSKFGDVEDLVLPLVDHFRDHVFPVLRSLRTQIIHNDGHQGNLLRSAEGADDFVGIIDFGDMVYAPIIDDLVISVESIMAASDDPIEAGAAVVLGFHEQCPLLREEVEILYDLCLVRGALTIELFDFRIRHPESENERDKLEYPEVVDDFKRNMSVNGADATKRWLAICGI